MTLRHSASCGVKVGVARGGGRHDEYEAGLGRSNRTGQRGTPPTWLGRSAWKGSATTTPEPY